jgi:hypothetical protein
VEVPVSSRVATLDAELTLLLLLPHAVPMTHTHTHTHTLPVSCSRYTQLYLTGREGCLYIVPGKRSLTCCCCSAHWTFPLRTRPPEHQRSRRAAVHGPRLGRPHRLGRGPGGYPSQPAAHLSPVATAAAADRAAASAASLLAAAAQAAAGGEAGRISALLLLASRAVASRAVASRAVASLVASACEAGDREAAANQEAQQVGAQPF